MKLVEYQRYEDFKTFKFETEAGYEIDVTVRYDGTTNVECDSASFEELQEVIEMIKSGKVVIEV